MFEDRPSESLLERSELLGVVERESDGDLPFVDGEGVKGHIVQDGELKLGHFDPKS